MMVRVIKETLLIAATIVVFTAVLLVLHGTLEGLPA